MSIHDHSSFSSKKWQTLQHIIHQHPDLSPNNISQKFEKIVVMRFLAENSLVFLLQYIGLMMSALSASPNPLWFATGTATGFIFLRGISVLPGIGLGSLFAYYFATGHFILACEYAIVYLLQAWLLLWLSYRFISPTLVFYQKKIFLKFILLTSLLILAMSFTLLFINHSAFSIKIILYVWLANLNSILIISCGLMTLDAYFSAAKAQYIYKISFLYGLFFIFVLSLIFQQALFFIIILSALLFILTLVISYYLGWCGVMAAVFLLGYLLGLAAFMQAPLFSGSSKITVLFFLQSLILISTVTGLFVSLLLSKKPSINQ